MLARSVTNERRVGIRQVAAAAGVSVTTVSDALTGKGRLPESTRKRVQEAALALGYRPNVTARNLARGRAGVLVLTLSVVPGGPVVMTEGDFFIQVLTSATTVSLEHGYSLTISLPRYQSWSTLPVDGAIVLDPVPKDAALADLRRMGVPHVTVGREPAGDIDTDSVDNDHLVGTRMMLDHLVTAGASRVALISSPPVHSYALDALRTYRIWCRDVGQDPMVVFARDALSESAGYAAALRLLEAPALPDAIYATLGRLALGAKLAAETRGVRVPGDLLLAGLTDSAASTAAQLTVLDVRPLEIGRAAAELLIARLEGQERPPTHTVVTAEVIHRASTARTS